MAIADHTIDDLLETFSLFDDWEDRYRYIIELAQKIPPYPEDFRTDEFKVRGCASQVWLHPKFDGDIVDFDGDSDAHIVKGLIAVLMIIYAGKSKEEALAIDAKAVLGELGLAEHLSPMRTNGLFSMVSKIREMSHA